MTIRPQLASSPAIAVLTSGLSAIDLAILRADAGLAAPVTLILTNLVAPSPSRISWVARLCMTFSSLALKSARRLSPARLILAAPAAPVANRRQVSLVEVSPSTVTELKVVRVNRANRDCSTPGDRVASVTMKASMVAMSGAIMPEPLAMPLMRTVTPSISAVSEAPLAKVSVVMIVWAASCQASARRLCSRS